MNTHAIVFSFSNKREQIIIPLQDPITWLEPTYEENIILHYNKNNFLLSKSTIYHDMQKFSGLLTKALKNELSLHKSIKFNIGFLYNEYLYDKSNFVAQVLSDGTKNWVGFEYHLWEATSNNYELITWIYNTSNGSIIFEITPFYPYMYCDPEEEPNYIPYDEWIKTYKPFLIRTLSRETAQEWLDQAEFLIKTMDEYVRKWEEAHK